mgnify:CR=1 FL=1
MENASKALIMAGGILITILVVSLLVLFWNQVSDYKKTSSDAEKEAQLSTFNEQFTQYARTDLRGVDLISLVNKVINYNSKKTGAGEIDYSQKITLVVTIGQEFRTKYATDSSLELFKDDTYEITDNNNNLVKVINSQKELEDKYTLKALDKLSSNYEALKTYYYSTDEEEKINNLYKGVTLMALINCPECGKEVSLTAVSCPHCGYGVKKHFEDIEKEKALAAYQQTLALKREKTNQLLKIIIPIAIVVFTIIISLIANISILAERKTFKSTDDMYNFLTSCKNWQLDSTSSNEYLVIYNYGLGQIISDNGMFNIGDEITLHPSRGTFDLQGRKYVVSKSGDIIYNSGSYEYVYQRRNFPMNIEEPADVLKIEVLSSDVDEQGMFNAEYKVTNTGTRSYRLIELSTVFTLTDGSKMPVKNDFEIVKTDDEDNLFVLNPGESGYAKAFLENAPDNIKNSSVHIKKFYTEQ